MKTSNLKKKLYMCSFFLFGVLYYLVFPVLFSNYYMSKSLPLSNYIGKLLFRFNYFEYYIYIVLLLFCFIFSVFCMPNKYKKNIIKVKKTEGFIFLTLTLIFLLLLINYFLLKDQLFKGYAGLNWNEKNSQKSLVSGFNVFLSAFTTYLWCEKSKARWFSAIITFVNSIVLLGLGGRMYVLVVIICMATYFILYKNISLKRIFIFMASAFILLLVMGVIRQGGNLSLENVFFVFIAEPMFNWLSAGSLIRFNDINLFEVPSVLISSLLSMIPTLLWEGKLQLLQELSSNAYLIESPVGGTNIIASLLSSFGIIGSLFAMLLFGLLGGYFVRRSSEDSFHFMVLCIFCSLMPFMFFRDNITIFQKNLFFNGIILPFIIIKLNSIFGRCK